MKFVQGLTLLISVASLVGVILLYSRGEAKHEAPPAPSASGLADIAAFPLRKVAEVEGERMFPLAIMNGKMMRSSGNTISIQSLADGRILHSHEFTGKYQLGRNEIVEVGPEGKLKVYTDFWENGFGSPGIHMYSLRDGAGATFGDNAGEMEAVRSFGANKWWCFPGKDSVRLLTRASRYYRCVTAKYPVPLASDRTLHLFIGERVVVAVQESAHEESYGEDLHEDFGVWYLDTGDAFSGPSTSEAEWKVFPEAEAFLNGHKWAVFRIVGDYLIISRFFGGGKSPDSCLLSYRHPSDGTGKPLGDTYAWSTLFSSEGVVLFKRFLGEPVFFTMKPVADPATNVGWCVVGDLDFRFKEILRVKWMRGKLGDLGYDLCRYGEDTLLADFSSGGVKLMHDGKPVMVWPHQLADGSAQRPCYLDGYIYQEFCLRGSGSSIIRVYDPGECASPGAGLQELTQNKIW